MQRRSFFLLLAAPFLPENIDYSDIPPLDDSFFTKPAYIGPLPVPTMAEWQAMEQLLDPEEWAIRKHRWPWLVPNDEIQRQFDRGEWPA